MPLSCACTQAELDALLEEIKMRQELLEGQCAALPDNKEEAELVGKNTYKNIIKEICSKSCCKASMQLCQATRKRQLVRRQQEFMEEAAVVHGAVVHRGGSRSWLRPVLCALGSDQLRLSPNALSLI